MLILSMIGTLRLLIFCCPSLEDERSGDATRYICLLLFTYVQKMRKKHECVGEAIKNDSFETGCDSF